MTSQKDGENEGENDVDPPRAPYPTMLGRAGEMLSYLGDIGKGSDVDAALGRDVRGHVSSRRGRGCHRSGGGHSGGGWQ